MASGSARGMNVLRWVGMHLLLVVAGLVIGEVVLHHWPMPWRSDEEGIETWAYLSMAYPARVEQFLVWITRLVLVDVVAVVYMGYLHLTGLLGIQARSLVRGGEERRVWHGDLLPAPKLSSKGLRLVIGEEAMPDGKGSTGRWVYIDQDGCYTSIIMIGSVGSGKTAGTIRPLLRQVIGYNAHLRGKVRGRRAPIGGVAFDVKGNLFVVIKEELQGAGRGDDYVELGIDRGWIYNPCADPSMDPQSVASSMTGLIEQIQGESKEQYWPGSYQKLMRYTVMGVRIAYDYTSMIDLNVYGASDDAIRKLIQYIMVITNERNYQHILVYANLVTNNPEPWETIVTESEEKGHVNLERGKSTRFEGRVDKWEALREWAERELGWSEEKIGAEMFCVANPAPHTRNDPFFHPKYPFHLNYIWFLRLPDTPEVRRYMEEHKVHHIVIDEKRVADAETFIRWYQYDWGVSDLEIRTKVYGGVSNILQYFDEFSVIDTFTPTMTVYYDVQLNPEANPGRRMFPCFDYVMTKGWWVCVDMPKGTFKRLASVICTLVKQAFQLTSIERPSIAKREKQPQWDYERQCVLVIDEYQFFATASQDDPGADNYWLSVARETGCWMIASTQTIENLKQRFPERSMDVTEMILGCIRNKVFLSAANQGTAEYASKQVGEGIVHRKSWNVGESSNQAGLSVLTGDYEGSDASVNQSVSWQEQRERLYTERDFLDLRTYEGIGLIFDGRQRAVKRIFMKPYYRPYQESWEKQEREGIVGVIPDDTITEDDVEAEDASVGLLAAGDATSQEHSNHKAVALIGEPGGGA